MSHPRNNVSTDNLIKRTRNIHEGRTESGEMEDWEPEEVALDLSEQVGDIAETVLEGDTFNSPTRERSELASTLADIIFDLIVLAIEYDIDIESEYDRVLREFERRPESGKNRGDKRPRQDL